MPGPPPTPLQLKLLRGNPGKRRLNAEPQPALAERVPDPPEFLSGFGAEEWRRVAPELYRLGLLTVLDGAALAAYCQAYATWRIAEEGLTKLTESDQRRRPLARIARDGLRDMVRFAAEFGMTPASRSRVGNGRRLAGKFDGFIG